MVNQLGDHLRELRPSQDERFARRVQFLVAVRTGDLARVESELAADPSLLEAPLSGEDWGRAEMDQPTLPLEFDYTPLHFAANYGQRDLADLLLRHGADPNAHLRQETPLGRAVDADLVCVGHTHWPMQRSICSVHVINDGSVSNPWSPDLRASYMLIDADDSGYQVHLHRVEYDRTAAIEAVRSAHHPSGDFIVGWLSGELASWWDSKVWSPT